MHTYLSTSTVLDSFHVLRGLEFSSESILHLFFILKACGFDDLTPKPVSDVKTFGLEPGFVLGSLFGDGEKLPEKYSFINPFKLSTWASQPSESLKKWVTLRAINNITGGARSWRKVVDYDPDEETLKLTYNYLDNLKELTFQDTPIDLQAFSVWAARFARFETNPSMYDLIKSMQRYFHLSDHEMSQLFQNKATIPLSYGSTGFDTSAVRRIIIPDGAGTEWVEPEHETTNVTTLRSEYMDGAVTNEKNVDIEKIGAALHTFGNVILSGPPATSKSFLAKQVSQSYTATKSVQFHPEYTYQDFIGGYFVQGDTVVFEKGVLTNLAEEASQHPEARYLLIIDEINRGNLSSIFGETIQALDRNYTVHIKIGAHSFDLTLPKNLHILATRNTTDKSLSNVDLAVYRRFIDFKVMPNADVLSELVEIEGGISARDLLNKINRNLVTLLSDETTQVGHALFLNDTVRREDGKFFWSTYDFELLFAHSILPLITEYCQGNGDKVAQVVGSAVLQSIGTDQFTQTINDFVLIDA